MEKYYDALEKLGSIDLQCYNYEEENQEALTPLYLNECYNDEILLLGNIIKEYKQLDFMYDTLSSYCEYLESQSGIEVLTKFTIELEDTFRQYYQGNVTSNKNTFKVVAKTKEEAINRLLENIPEPDHSISRECTVLTFEDIIVGKVYHNEK